MTKRLRLKSHRALMTGAEVGAGGSPAQPLNGTLPNGSKASHWLGVLILALAGLGGPQAAGVAGAVAGSSCSDVEVVFARGTFEAPGIGATGQAFVDALNARLAGPSATVYSINYPASLDFPRAIDGVADAITQINSIASNCPATKIVLGGYSQGAAVAAYTTSDAVPAGYSMPAGVTQVISPKTAAHVAAVALFGTPSQAMLDLFYPAAPPIVIGKSYADKTIELCAPADPICSPGGLDRAAHSAYKDNGMAEQAADFAIKTMSNRR